MPDKDRHLAELADVARLIARADAEAARLRVRRLGLWRQARAAGLSWRAIARASGVDHAMVAKVTGEKERGRIDV